MSEQPLAETDVLRDLLAEAIYAGGDETEWLTTVDGSPNSASYALADRALAALPFEAVIQRGWRCRHGVAGPYADRGERASCDDDTAVPVSRIVVAKYVGPWVDDVPLPPVQGWPDPPMETVRDQQGVPLLDVPLPPAKCGVCEWDGYPPGGCPHTLPPGGASA